MTQNNILMISCIVCYVILNRRAMPRGIILQEAHTPCRKLRYFTLTDDECFFVTFSNVFFIFSTF